MHPRFAVARSNATVFGVTGRRLCQPARLPVRFQSTSSTSSWRSSLTFDASHFAAGFAGGLTVVLAGKLRLVPYNWPQDLVKTSKEMKNYLRSSTDKVLSKANETAKNPSQALSHLRDIAKSYTFLIPGADGYVDNTFDELEDLYDTHVDEMDMILRETTEELVRAMQSRRADAETARNVSGILGRSIRRMKELGKKAGGDILDRNPAIKEKLGSSYEQFQSLAQSAGPEGKKALKEAKDRIKEVISKGKVDEVSITKVQEFIQEKTSQLRRSVGESQIVEELFRNVPDTEELFKKAPHAQELANLARQRSEDAKNLVKETVSDVVSVLEEKGKKARELSERTKTDAEKRDKN